MKKPEGPKRPVLVLGAGAWGSALAIAAARQSATTLWGRDPLLMQNMADYNQNRQYLPNIEFPDSLQVTSDFDAALAAVSSSTYPGLIIIGTPIAGLRATCRDIADWLGQASRSVTSVVGVIWTCKGLETGSGELPNEIARQAFASQPTLATGVLSGPSFAKEVAAGLPVALTVASHHAALRTATIEALHGGAVRVYASDDVTGVEIGGALKNVMAIACGIADGLGLGTNARAALITRGLAEITRFGCALGAQAATFAGLTGLGDLVLTATGDLSRNRQVGLAIGQGQSAIEVLGQGLTAEGARCALAVRERSNQMGLTLPITEAVCAVLFEGMPPRDAVGQLLSREATTE